MFRQTIEDGWQHEQPDNWLRRPDPWEVARPDDTVEVRLNASVEVREGALSPIVGRPSALGRPGVTPGPGTWPEGFCRELAHFPPAAGRPGRPVLLSEQVKIAGEVRAIEADRLILLAGTVVRIPLELHVPGYRLPSLGPFLDVGAQLPHANRAWRA